MSETSEMKLSTPLMDAYTHPLKRAERQILGRNEEIKKVLAGLMRPELCNVMLLGEPGAGKTALVQAVMLIDKNSSYLEVDLSKMIADCKTDVNEMAAKLKTLFDEVEAVIKQTGKHVVLFIDEFHQIVQLSPAAVEALKPLLADSGTRGIKVIAATTYREFREYISANQPLVERLQRINVAEPSEEVVISILRGMSERYGVSDQFPDDSIFKLIYDLTNQYIPANAQPRKSILILDAMIGWNRAFKRPLDRTLLEEVFMQAENVSVSTQVDATAIADQLRKRVLAQEFAVRTIEQRLHIAIADMADDTKPKSSFLFTGSTGVGKGLTNDTIVPVWTPDSSILEKRNGDLKIGDYVYNRKGEPVKVVGVFPRGMQDIYKVTLNDGRYLLTDSSHLWTYMLSKGKNIENTYTNNTKELFDRGVCIKNPKTGKPRYKYWIPMNQAVQYPTADLSVHPYVMGAFIGDGSLTVEQLTLSSSDEELVAHVSELLGGCSYEHNKRNYNWVFPLHEKRGRIKTKQMREVFADYPEVCGKKANEKSIPKAYMFSSIEQRWDLVKGLFDTDGSISGNDDGRYNVSYSTTSLQLANDIQTLLYSLGVSSTVDIARKGAENRLPQYVVRVKSSNANKDRFFWLQRKVDIANKAKEKIESKSKKKDYEWLAITSIEKLDEKKETTCIMVDDEEHLYQAGQYVVSHNTEMTKAMAKLLFNDERRLIRFDMTEFANPNSMERFRRELTSQIWTRPYAIVLLDEIEKACAEVTRLLLGVLDDGRLLDENNREVTFNNAYIILTTNAASEIYQNIAQYQSSDTGDGAAMRKYDALIRRSIMSATGSNKFPPELLGRIDCIVPFQPLSEKTQCDITRMRLEKIRKRLLDKHGVKMSYSEDVITYLVKDTLTTDSNSGGARAIMNKLNTEVVSAISEFINKHPTAKRIGVSIGGEMASEDKYRLESAAYVKVGPI